VLYAEAGKEAVDFLIFLLRVRIVGGRDSGGAVADRNFKAETKRVQKFS
jgi:hypothetical protein